MDKAGREDLVSVEVFQNSVASLLYCEASSLLTLNWKRQIDFEERKEVFLWALDFSIAQKVKNWLIDDEEIFVITSREQQWIEDEWTKMVARTGITKIAVRHPDHYNNLVAFTDFTFRARDKYKQYGITQHEAFADYETALRWLLSEKG